ncbi:putative ABC multidrug transporter [Xylaria scruposa]|nr:putative ABC multidrug transporter [Xylaria scruposa]
MEKSIHLAQSSIAAREGTLSTSPTSPQHKTPFGIAFRDLSCHAFITRTRYQGTFASALLENLNALITLFTRNKPTRVTILHSFDGLILPGQMVLVLGRPGSGCSTLLKTLAGDTHGFHVRDTTSINYQSITYPEMHRDRRGECIYLAELDVHFPELTLDDTLTFAASSRIVGSERKARSREMSQKAASLFYFHDAMNTRIGSAMIRGISGGEKRRTSLAEALIADGQLMLLDNSTSGLDSATALRFIELLRKTTISTQKCVVMSIYQASNAMFQNFDKVMLLYEGRQIYFGPVDEAVRYFEALGFVRPNRTTYPDFLTSLTNPEERIVRDGFKDSAPRSPDEFAGVWRQSLEARRLSNEIANFNSMHTPSQPISSYSALLQLNMSYVLSIHQQIGICVDRAILRLRQALDPIISALFGHTILGLVVGSILYNLDGSADSLENRSIVVFLALVNSAFSPAFEVLTMWAQRPIVEKHHRYAFYHPSTESIASMICDLPNKILISLLFHIPVYFLTNLRRTAPAFFTYWLFMFTTVLAMSSIFRTIGSLSRRIEQTSAPSAIIVVLTIIYTGFVVPPKYMVPWLAWFRFVNPLAYTFESLLINEFRGRNFPCTSSVPSGAGYPQSGMPGTVCSAMYAKPGQHSVQGSDYIASKYGYSEAHLWRNLGILLLFMVAFGVIHILSIELNPPKRSQGEILTFVKRQVRKKKRAVADVDENQPPIFVQDAHVLNSRYGDSNYASQAEKEDLARTFQEKSSVVHWTNVGYTIKTRHKRVSILEDIHGWVKPGTLTALMGATGAGKTTLLDVLSNRTIHGDVSGSVYVDGSLRDPSFSRRIGYVQQDDIHMSTSTIREALLFSAMLRQPRIKSTTQKLAHVDNIIHLLDMDHYADAIVGVPGEGLNVEQRKRLTIGVEMAAGPELLLFLDEPTSGLDSQTAWSICKLLRKLADHGQTIMCTIHQPSAELFEMFDSLLLLDKGGYELYFGPIGADGSSVVNYFEAHEAPKCPPTVNPAEWIVDITSRGNTAAESRTWSQIWGESEQKREVLQHLATLTRKEHHGTTLNPPVAEYATPFIRQLAIVTRRLFQSYWRSPQYVYSKLTVSFGIALVNGISFYNSPHDIQGLTNNIFGIFLITQQFSTIGQQIIPRLVDSRSIFEARERRNRSYSWSVFIASNILVELWWQTVSAVLAFVSWYYPTGMWKNGDSILGTAERGAITFILIWLFCLWNSTLSQALAAGVEHSETAVQFATLLFWLTLVFSGILVAPGALPGFWIFMYRVSPQTYLMNGLILAGLAGTEIACSATEALQIDMLPSNATSCGSYLEEYVTTHGGYVINPEAVAGCQYCPLSSTNDFLAGLGMQTDHPWRLVGLVVVYIVFNILAAFGFYYLRVRSWDQSAKKGS